MFVLAQVLKPFVVTVAVVTVCWSYELCNMIWHDVSSHIQTGTQTKGTWSFLPAAVGSIIARSSESHASLGGWVPIQLDTHQASAEVRAESQE